MQKNQTKDIAPNEALKPRTEVPIEERPATIIEKVQPERLQPDKNVLEQAPKDITIPDKTIVTVNQITYPQQNETPEKAKNPETVDTQQINVNKVPKSVVKQDEPIIVPFEQPKITADADWSNATQNAPISLINQLPPTPIEPADLSRMIKEPVLPSMSEITTIIHRENIFDIKPSSIYMKFLDRPRPFITTAITVSSLYESGQGQRIAPTLSDHKIVFETSAAKYVPENTSVMSILPAWNDTLFREYGIYTITGNVVSESMYTAWYSPSNPQSNTPLEEQTGRALMMLVMMYEPKPIMIDNKKQLISIKHVSTGFDHLEVLNNKTILKPPSESIALAVPSMRNGIIAEKLSERIHATDWQIGRIAAITDDNGVDVQLDIADDVDQFTAYAYNEVGKRMLDSTMTASEFSELLDKVKIPGTTVQIMDTTDRAKYHHDFIDNPRAGELVLSACCMQPEFARSLRPNLIKYLRSSGAIIENLSGRPDDGSSREPGYIEFMSKFREATQSMCVDAFYSSQIPKVTIPEIRRHPTDGKHIYGIIPVYAAIQFTRVFPHLAFYARDEIARIIFDFGVQFFAEETRNFLDKYGRYNGIPGDNTAFSSTHGFAGNVPSIFLEFNESIPYYSDIAPLLKYTKSSFTQPYDEQRCPRFNKSNISWPAYYQKVSDLDDSRTPMDLNIVVSVIERIIAKINKVRKIQGSVIDTVVTYIRGNAVELKQFVPAMETELAQLERTVTTLPLTLGTHFQGSMSEPFSPILALETTHPSYQEQPMFMEQLDPSWRIDISVILVCGYGVTMRMGEVANTTASNTVKLEQQLTFPNAIHEYFSQLGIISGLSLQMQPYGLLDAIWSQEQTNPDILALRHAKKIRNVDIHNVLQRFAEIHQKALNVGVAPQEFKFTGSIVTQPTNVIETDPLLAFRTLRSLAVDGEGNLHTRKTLLIDPKFALYGRNRLRLPDEEQQGQWAKKKVRFLSEWDTKRMGAYAGFVKQDTFMSRKRNGLLILSQPVEVWDPTVVLNPREVKTSKDEPFTIVEIWPKDIGATMMTHTVRSTITVTLPDGTRKKLMNDEDFHGFIFEITNPSIFADEDRAWLTRLVQDVEFGILLSSIEYTSINLEMTHRTGAARQVSIAEILRFQDKSVNNIVFPDSRHILPTPYDRPMGQMYRYVFPILADAVRLIGKDWFQVTDKLSENFKMPDEIYFNTGKLTPELRPALSDGTLKTTIDALSASNQLRVFLPSSQLNKSFIVRVIMPSNIFPA